MEVKHPPFTGMAMPMATAKVVHLVRHGQAEHNVAARDIGKAAYVDARFLDARLDAVGVEQAKQLGRDSRALLGGTVSTPAVRAPTAAANAAVAAAAAAGAAACGRASSGAGAGAALSVAPGIAPPKPLFDIVLCSPLTRTLQTASLAFPDDRLVAVELCREAFGLHPCDQRRPRSTVEKEFPTVDFSGVPSDEDVLFRPDVRETIEEVAKRARAFLKLLRDRPEKTICVVSHGVFLETLLSPLSGLAVDGSLTQHRFGNCELRSIVLGGNV